MNKSKILGGLVLLTYVLYVVFQFGGEDLVAFNLRSLIFPIVALTYFICIREKTILFNLFLIFYAFSELLDLIANHLSDTFYYFLGSSLYILAYIMLIIEIWQSMNFSYLLKNFKIHLLVLVGLNIYSVYVLHVVVKSYLDLNYQLFMEFVYNVVMLTLLSSSLLNYLYRNNKKSLYMFIGSLLIVFSEVISVAYMYIYPANSIHLIVVSLSLLAFYFFYQQSRLNNISQSTY
jgi:hypothetical protein